MEQQSTNVLVADNVSEVNSSLVMIVLIEAIETDLWYHGSSANRLFDQFQMVRPNCRYLALRHQARLYAGIGVRVFYHAAHGEVRTLAMNCKEVEVMAMVAPPCSKGLPVMVDLYLASHQTRQLDFKLPPHPRVEVGSLE